MRRLPQAEIRLGGLINGILKHRAGLLGAMREKYLFFFGANR
ncbi:hypothetical protein [Candidatus Methylacidiphilum fumarolicum]|nr:hypothetical protein [Candidatus Methylacidiphilum fumarolicum]